MRIIRIVFILLTLSLPLFSGPVFGDEGCIKDEVKKALIMASPWEAGDMDISDVQLSGYNDEDFDKVEIKVPDNMKNIGKVSVQAVLSLKGKEVKALWATARIRVFKEVVVALNPLKANTKIAKGDIRVMRTEVNDARDSFPTMGEVEGMVVKRPIPAGSVVKKDYVKPEVVVKRGERVVLNFEADRLRVRSTGVASEDGASGGVIAVKTSSGKAITGKVSGPGEITVGF